MVYVGLFCQQLYRLPQQKDSGEENVFCVDDTAKKFLIRSLKIRIGLIPLP